MPLAGGDLAVVQIELGFIRSLHGAHRSFACSSACSACLTQRLTDACIQRCASCRGLCFTHADRADGRLLGIHLPGLPLLLGGLVVDAPSWAEALSFMRMVWHNPTENARNVRPACDPVFAGQLVE